MRFFIILVILLFVNPLFAAPVPIPAPPSFNVKSYILMDYRSDLLIAELNADERVDPASITKLMTAYIVYQSLGSGDIKLTDKVLVSEKAWRAVGSRMFIEVGDEITVDELLKGLIIQSGNDASIALAEHIGGTEEAFAGIMNNEAQRLGLLSTHYVNATGLTDENHYTTARDIAQLAKAIIRDFPEEYKRYAQKEFTYNGITQYNRNKLLWRDPAVDGLKTGHTDAAGYCLAASAEKNDMRLISVVLGASSEKTRATHSQALLNYGFRFFESRKIYSGGDVLTEKRIWYGDKEQAQLGITEDLYITLPKNRYQDLKAYMDLEKRMEAPLEKHQRVGKVRVSLDGENYATQDLVAMEPVAEGGIVRKLTDFVLSYFE